jgi:hypothetical protein
MSSGEKDVVVVRAFSVPERITLFGLGCVAIATVYPALSARTGFELPCPLRTLTGIPCPFCGMTTATVALASGEVTGAAAANPLALLVAALVLGTLPILVGRLVGLRRPPVPWSDLARRRTGWAVGVLVAASWVFQLHRFHWL